MKRRIGDTVNISGDYQYNAINSTNLVQKFWHYSKQTAIYKFLPPRRGDSILDIGCGSGVISNFLAASGASVIGIDGSGRAINFAKKKYNKGNLHFIKGLVDESFYKGEKVDKIYCMELIEHIYEPQAEILLKKCNLLLKNGGKLFLTTPNYHSAWPLLENLLDLFSMVPKFKDSQHVCHYTHRRLKGLAAKTGFKISVKASNCMIAPWIAPLNLKLAIWIDQLELALRNKYGPVLVYVLEKDRN